MQRNIQVIIRLDPTEYLDTPDNKLGAIEVVRDILLGKADFPPNCEIDIISEELRRTYKMNETVYRRDKQTTQTLNEPSFQRY